MKNTRETSGYTDFTRDKVGWCEKRLTNILRTS